MTRKEWQEKYHIADIDMEFIDEARNNGCKISEVENPPLSYEIISYNKC